MTETKLFGKINQRQENWLYAYIKNDQTLIRFNSFPNRVNTFKEAESLIEKSTRDPKKYCISLMDLCKGALLEDEVFKWLDVKDKRLCSWAWLFISTNPLKYFEQRFCIPTTFLPTSSEDRVRMIKETFDCYFQVDLENKLDYMNFLVQSWAKVFPTLPSYSWLNSKDGEQINWAWDYLKERNVIHYNQKPVNNDEQYLAIIAAFDAWNEHPDSLKLIIDGAKRAWSQKKHRDSRGDRKAYNFIMTAEVKKQLDVIASEKGMRLYEALEWLITSEANKKT